MRIKGTLVLAALAAAAVAVGLGQPAVAAPAERAMAAPNLDSHGLILTPTVGHQRAAGGGGRGHDFTGDGIPDILARSTSGALLVYPNSGTFNGTATYPSSTFINGGWGGFSWIGSADLNGDGFADVVATDVYGNMYAAIHSGQFNGTRTLQAGLVYLGSGWYINDLVYVYDFDGDGLDDILARRAGTGDSYVYFNDGLNGTATLEAPQQFAYGGEADSYQALSDVDLDGDPDFVFMTEGYLVMIPFDETAEGAILGYGWNTVNSITFTDVDNDGRDDIIAKRNSDSTLLAYQRTTTWTVSPDNTAFGTYRSPVAVGYNWFVNNIIA